VESSKQWCLCSVISGEAGAIGQPGDKRQAGSPSNQGVQCEAGDMGQPGTPASVGVQGQPGDPGERGQAGQVTLASVVRGGTGFTGIATGSTGFSGQCSMLSCKTCSCTSIVFSARQHICYSALYAIACPSVRPSVCLSVPLSVTRVDQSKTVEVRITQPSPQSSPMTLVS